MSSKKNKQNLSLGLNKNSSERVPDPIVNLKSSEQIAKEKAPKRAKRVELPGLLDQLPNRDGAYFPAGVNDKLGRECGIRLSSWIEEGTIYTQVAPTRSSITVTNSKPVAHIDEAEALASLNRRARTGLAYYRRPAQDGTYTITREWTLKSGGEQDELAKAVG